MIFAETNLLLEPAWPWSLSNVGVPGMLAAAVVLAALTIWTYLGVRGATTARVCTLVLLRLAALALVFFLVLRPSFGVTHLEGVEPSRWIVVFDASESMNVADAAGQTTRWEELTRLWNARTVQRRLESLKRDEKIEIIKYVGADELRPDEAAAVPTGKRTDIGMWLHQLWQKHGHEKNLRGIAIFSDGGDNGTRFSALDKARPWRGVCRLDAFGVGDPGDARLGKDLALTQLRVEPAPVGVMSKMTIRAMLQAPGFEKSDSPISLTMEATSSKKAHPLPEVPNLTIQQGKDQPIVIQADAPAEAGEYKLTLKIPVQTGETNKDNNEISTFVQVVKQQINVLWIDRPRWYEPTFALRYALVPESRLRVRYAEPAGMAKDPVGWYELDKQDVIVIGDVSARQFSFGDDAVFDRIKTLVEQKKVGLLMLGGTETFVAGGWDKQKAILGLLPVKLDKTGFSEAPARAMPTKDGLQHPFLQLFADRARNDDLWKNQFDELDGLAPLGSLTADGVALLKARDDVVMAMRRAGEGRVVVFGGDSTSRSWYGNPQAIDGYRRFWKQLIFWLAQQEDKTDRVWVNLDRRRIATGERLAFTFGMRGKSGVELPAAQFTAKIVGPKQEQLATFVRDGEHQRGSFEGVRAGEYQLVVTGVGKEGDGGEVKGEATARFLVESDDIEMQRPAADHELLARIAAAADGRFSPAGEQPLLQLVDALREQVVRDSRVKTTQWPDWKRVPASDRLGDQAAGIWASFGLAGLLLFTLLLGAEWSLRRWWGMV